MRALFSTASKLALGLTQPPMQWVPGALSRGVKRSRRESDHSPPSSVEVKNAWSYTRVYPEVSGLSHNEINNNNNRQSLRSNTKAYGGKTH
jgi:hypothetical protein